MAPRASRSIRRVATAGVVVILLAPQRTSPGAADQIHLTYRADPAASITVAWHTTQAVASPIVQFGTTPAYGSVAPASSHASSGTGYIHEADLTGLVADTLYHYRVRDDAGGFGSDRTFRTAPPRGAPATLEFTVVGDIGATPDMQAVTGQMAAGSPRFHLLAGDLTYANVLPASEVQGRIDTWFNLLEPLASAGAAMPAWGGHEYGAPDGISNYFSRFALPDANGESFYALDAADIHVVMLNTSNAFGPGSPQYAWLDGDLAAAAANPGIRWKIACFHAPLYSSGMHGSSLDVRSAWQPIFDARGVDLVLTAHDHDYERSRPVRSDGVPTTAEDGVYVNPAGQVYVVAGGGGQGPRAITTARPAWSAWREDRTNFHVRLSVSPEGRLVGRALRQDGEEMDRFAIWKVPAVPGNAPPALSLSSSPPEGPEPLEVRFAASASDPDGDPLSIEWEFGDAARASGTFSPSHTYARAGWYRAQATIRDGRGNVAVATTPVVVSRPGDALATFRTGVWRWDGNRDDRWEGLDLDRSFAFGAAAALPVAGDFDGNGVAEAGVFSNGTWSIDLDGSGTWGGVPPDLSFSFGQAGDQPVLGDWTGNGISKIGVFRAGRWFLDANGNGAWDGPAGDLAYVFGIAGDVPVAGDWTGNGVAKIGVFRAGRWFLDTNGNGAWDGPAGDLARVFGVAGDLPATGDWTGNGVARIGVFRRGRWFLDANGNGVWDGNAADRAPFLGPPDARPVPRRP